MTQWHVSYFPGGEQSVTDGRHVPELECAYLRYWQQGFGHVEFRCWWRTRAVTVVIWCTQSVGMLQDLQQGHGS